MKPTGIAATKAWHPRYHGNAANGSAAKSRSAERPLNDVDLIVELAQPHDSLRKSRARSAIRPTKLKESLARQLKTISLLTHALKHLRIAATNLV